MKKSPALATMLSAPHVALNGLSAARHLRGDIYEIRADGRDTSYRLLFAAEGRYSQVLLALDFYAKKRQMAPQRVIARAAMRLRAHRARGQPAGDG